MCYKLFDEPTDFMEIFYERFLAMCLDPIKNVRVSSLMVVDKYIQKNDPCILKEKKYLKSLLISFKDDGAREVGEILSRYTFVINKAA
jgi:hypothetical protein